MATLGHVPTAKAAGQAGACATHPDVARPRPSTLARQLETWFSTHARSLPWRDDANGPHGPYRVWVSEIMLQQTQVATVVPYYERWMARWPTLADLAGAELEEVLGAWAGLGYYARARNLHRATRKAHAEGGVPSTLEGLRALPGIGPYTAGAILSIAFEQKVPLVDGNVARVLCRHEGLEGDATRPPLSQTLWARAEALVAKSHHPGRLNESLMELGATLCTPRTPACTLCPIQRGCVARREGRAEALPTPVPARTRKVNQAFGLLAWHRGALALVRRRPDGLLGGLWEPPLVNAPAVADARNLGHAVHVFTHLELTVHVFETRLHRRGELTGLEDLYDEVAWHPPGEVGDVPLSKLARKILAVGGVG